jgi:small conductance mechanosensitive channel
MNKDLTYWQEKLGNLLEKHGPGLVSGICIFAGGLLLAHFVGGFVMRWLERRPLEPPVRMLIVRAVKLFLIGIALVIALGTAGMDIAPLVAGIGVAGVGIGLALQGVLSNLVAGLLIIFTKPFRVGEYIEIIGEQGEVQVIDLFTTTLLHADRSRVIIPNRKISGEVLHNYGNIRQLDITVGVAYGTHVPNAIAAVRDVLQKNPRVLKDPAPAVALAHFADSAVNIAVKPWTKVADFGPAGDEIRQAILERFRGEGIEIPFPQREIRVLDGALAGARAS